MIGAKNWCFFLFLGISCGTVAFGYVALREGGAGHAVFLLHVMHGGEFFLKGNALVVIFLESR